ncbi:MAG TPA: hypothetical protein VNT27_11295 [Propionibacteriaceae bacterium]|nr:hypothetical protein [Propionibacteriaceae bacterium]
MSKVVALEAGAHGVTSNCVSPGYVRRPLVEKQIADPARAHGVPEADVLERCCYRQRGQAARRAGRGRRTGRLPVIAGRLVRQRGVVADRWRLDGRVNRVVGEKGG